MLLAILMLFLIPGAGACQEDQNIQADARTEKIEISSDRLTANQNRQSVVFSGNVKAVQGSTTIFSDTLNVHYNEKADTNNRDIEDSINKIIASGNVRIEFEDKTARCDRAVYVTKNQSLTLTGDDTRIESDGNFLSGEKITIYQATGQIIVEGGEAKRVNAVFQTEGEISISD